MYYFLVNFLTQRQGNRSFLYKINVAIISRICQVHVKSEPNQNRKRKYVNTVKPGWHKLWWVQKHASIFPPPLGNTLLLLLKQNKKIFVKYEEFFTPKFSKIKVNTTYLNLQLKPTVICVWSINFTCWCVANSHPLKINKWTRQTDRQKQRKRERDGDRQRQRQSCIITNTYCS